MLENGANPALTTSDNVSPLYIACMNHNIKILKVLLNHHTAHLTINMVSTKLQRTPLHVAMLNGLDEMVELLLEKGANPKITTRLSGSPLWIGVGAPKGNMAKCVELLLSKDPSLKYDLDTKYGLNQTTIVERLTSLMKGSSEERKQFSLECLDKLGWPLPALAPLTDEPEAPVTEPKTDPLDVANILLGLSDKVWLTDSAS